MGGKSDYGLLKDSAIAEAEWLHSNQGTVSGITSFKSTKNSLLFYSSINLSVYFVI